MRLQVYYHKILFLFITKLHKSTDENDENMPITNSV